MVGKYLNINKTIHSSGSKSPPQKPLETLSSEASHSIQTILNPIYQYLVLSEDSQASYLHRKIL